MTINSTTIGFLLSSLGFSFCGLKFFESFKRIGGRESGNKVGFLISTLFLTIASQHGVMGIGNMLFANNSEIIYIILVIALGLLAIASGVGAYLVSFIFFPRISPWFATSLTFILGAIVIFEIIILKSEVLLSSGHGINWNFPRNLSVNLYYLLLIQIGSVFFVFSKLLLNTKDLTVKIVSSVMMILAFGGIINVFLRFGVPPFAGKTQIFNIIITTTGILFIIIFAIIPITSELVYKFKKWKNKDKYRL